MGFLQELFTKNKKLPDLHKVLSRIEESENRILHQLQQSKDEDRQDRDNLTASLKKVELRQKEVILQMDSLSESLTEDESAENDMLIETIIEILDIIEDFYRFALASSDSPYAGQALMMWQNAQSSAKTNGLEVIDKEGEPFDFRKHSAEGTDSSGSVPVGCVVKTLKCGYEYKGNVLRRASVIVSKN